MHRFGEVQAHRTSSNLLELHPHRDNKVYRVLYTFESHLHKGIKVWNKCIGIIHTLILSQSYN